MKLQYQRFQPADAMLHCVMAAACSFLVLATLPVQSAETIAKSASSKANPATSTEIAPQLLRYFREASAQTEAFAKDLGMDEVPDSVTEFYELASTGQWKEMKALYREMNSDTDLKIRTTPIWIKLTEALGVQEAFVGFSPALLQAYREDVIDRVPPNALYLGGSDPGRYLPTLLVSDFARGKPFVVLTQNALAASTYLQYIRQVFGKQLALPTDAESQQSFKDYLTDATRRLESKELLPDEQVTKRDGKVIVGGRGAVMGINGILAKRILDSNPQREVFVEQSYPIQWMLPRLQPHGAILKLERSDVKSFTAELLSSDAKFWAGRMESLTGIGFAKVIPVKEFVEGVTSDRYRVAKDKEVSSQVLQTDFRASPYARKTWSDMRASQASVFAWRIKHSPSEKSSEPLAMAAELAFQQAVALDHNSKDAVSAYAQFLVQSGRKSDARLWLQELQNKGVILEEDIPQEILKELPKP